MRFGPSFKRTPKKVMRLHKAQQGPRMFEADEIRRMLDAAGPAMRAMILLGINCAFGPTDCARLPRQAVDLDAGVVDYPRPKTGINRRCFLWPETIAALKEVLAQRPAPKDPAAAGLVFLTRFGSGWCRD